MYGTDVYQRLVSPAGSLSTDTHECRGAMTYDYLLGKGYSSYVAEWVGGEAMRNYPALLEIDRMACLAVFCLH